MSSWTPPSGSALAFVAAELTSLAIFLTVVLFVPARATLIRAASACALTALWYAIDEALLSTFSDDPGSRALIGPAIFLQHMSACELIFFSRVDSAAFSGPDVLPPSTAGGIVQALALLCNMRRAGTKWQVKNLAPTPDSELGRTRFVLSRMTKLLLVYLLLDLISSLPPPDPKMMSSGKDTLFHLSSLSTEDLTFRAFRSTAFWTTLFCALTIQSAVVSSLFVLTGLSLPEHAPPPLGSFADACTLRGFWGSFWHQFLRNGLTGYSDYIADSVLGLQRGTKLSRYTRLFFIFAISGWYHRVADVVVGIPTTETGSMKFFLVQPFGIMLEDCVRALLVSRVSNARARQAIGYLWVFLFLAWSTPAWFYPTAKFGPKPDGMLPVRIQHFVKF